MKKEGEYNYFFENKEELLDFIENYLYQKEEIHFSTSKKIKNGYIGEFISHNLAIDTSVYNENKTRFEQAFEIYGEKNRQRIAEALENGEEMHYLPFDRFTYNKEFLESLIEYDPSLIFNIYIRDREISEDLLNLLLQNNIEVNAKVKNSDKSESFIPPYEFSRDDIYKIKKNWYNRFNYTRLLRANEDELKVIMTLPKITIYNALENYKSVQLYDNKMNEPNDMYLEKVYDIVTKLRNLGYNGKINIESENMYDFSNTRFVYASSTDFTINEIFKPNVSVIEGLANRYSSYFKDDTNSLEDKIRKIIAISAIELLNSYNMPRIVDSQGDDITKVFLDNYLRRDFVYDFCSFLGIKTIKYLNDDKSTSYFFYDISKQEFVETNISTCIKTVVVMYDHINSNIQGVTKGNSQATEANVLNEISSKQWQDFFHDDFSVENMCWILTKFVNVFEKNNSLVKKFLSCSTGEELFSTIDKELKVIINNAINEEKEFKKNFYDTHPNYERIEFKESDAKNVNLECVRQFYYDFRDLIIRLSTETYIANQEVLSNNNYSDSENTIDSYYSAIRRLCDMFISAKRRIEYSSSKVINAQDRFKRYHEEDQR